MKNLNGFLIFVMVCRRCFNLSDSFPTLFDLIDDTKSGEVVDMAKQDYPKVTDS
jgi:glycerol-3-phosphate dehydrogenase subunit C